MVVLNADRIAVVLLFIVDMDILSEAKLLVEGDRGEAYGHPAKKYELMAKIWSTILEKEITPQQVILCMLGVKLTREIIRHKRDNLVDLAGYALLLQQLSDEDI